MKMVKVPISFYNTEKWIEKVIIIHKKNIKKMLTFKIWHDNIYPSVKGVTIDRK